MFSFYPHQTAALKKSGFSKSFAFLMPPGTGKTFVLLEEAKQLYNDKLIDTLVLICPKILIHQWERAAEEYYKNGSALTYNIIVYKNYLKKYSIVRDCLNIFILNTESFSRDKSASILLLQRLYVVKKKVLLCLDESSKIKNHKAALTVNILKYTKEIDMYRRILTGSIITESPMDFYTQFKFLNPSIIGFYSFFAFRHYYANLTDGYTGYGTFKKITSYKNIDELVTKIKPYCYLLKIEDVTGMPDKIYENVYVDLNKEQRRMYEKLREEDILRLEEEPIEELNIVSAIDKLYKYFRIIQGHYLDVKQKNPKLAALEELIEIYPGKFIIFCRFVDDIYHITDILDSVSMIRGDVPMRKRQQIIDSYRSNETKHLVIMQQIGSYGLDLPETDYVAYFSCSYSGDQRMQSESRATRLSSKNTSVTYFNIVAENTVEERLYEILFKKKQMFINILKLLQSDR